MNDREHPESEVRYRVIRGDRDDYTIATYISAASEEPGRRRRGGSEFEYEVEEVSPVGKRRRVRRGDACE